MSDRVQVSHLIWVCPKLQWLCGRVEALVREVHVGQETPHIANKFPAAADLDHTWRNSAQEQCSPKETQ